MEVWWDHKKLKNQKADMGACRGWRTTKVYWRPYTKFQSITSIIEWAITFQIWAANESAIVAVAHLCEKYNKQIRIEYLVIGRNEFNPDLHQNSYETLNN